MLLIDVADAGLADQDFPRKRPTLEGIATWGSSW